MKRTIAPFTVSKASAAEFITRIRGRLAASNIPVNFRSVSLTYGVYWLWSWPSAPTTRANRRVIMSRTRMPLP